MSRTLTDGLRWAQTGTDLVRQAAVNVGAEDAWTAPSALPDWDRKYLLSHVTGNAQALRNLATWARTGLETPMYASTEQRRADIAVGAALPVPDLLAAFELGSNALADDWAGLSGVDWAAEVRTVVGRIVPASETPWMRAREVMVHAVDLGAGITFDDLPADFNAALAEDIVTKRAAGGGPAYRVQVSDGSLTWRWGDGKPSVVIGTLSQVTAWLAGRAYQDVIAADGTPAATLPAWL